MLLEISDEIDSLLTSIGYPINHGAEFIPLKVFSQKMFNKAKKASLIHVEDLSYLDEVEDYTL
jgi:hypothetical protein